MTSSGGPEQDSMPISRPARTPTPLMSATKKVSSDSGGDKWRTVRALHLDQLPYARRPLSERKCSAGQPGFAHSIVVPPRPVGLLGYRECRAKAQGIGLFF